MFTTYFHNLYYLYYTPMRGWKATGYLKFIINIRRDALSAHHAKAWVVCSAGCMEPGWATTVLTSLSCVLLSFHTLVYVNAKRKGLMNILNYTNVTWPLKNYYRNKYNFKCIAAFFSNLSHFLIKIELKSNSSESMYSLCYKFTAQGKKINPLNNWDICKWV